MKLKSVASFLLVICLCITMVPSVFGNEEAAIQKKDWVITGTELLENKTLHSNGTITLKSGGKLVVNKSRIVVDGSIAILAERGSILEINNSVIEPLKEDGRFCIAVHTDDFILSDTTISHVSLQTETNPPGIEIKGNNAKITKCNITGFINLYESENCLVKDNIIVTDKEKSNINTAIQITKSNNCTISGNQLLEFFTGVSTEYSNYNTIENNYWVQMPENERDRFVDKWWNLQSNFSVRGSGICLIEESNNNTVKNNTLIGNGCNALRIDQSTGNYLYGNKVKGVRVGVHMAYCSGNTVDSNELSDCWELEAFELYRASNNHIINNKITSSAVGLGLYSSTQNTISGNYVSKSGRALFLFDASENNIINNEFKENTNGVITDSSVNNTFAANNFINNYEQAYDKDKNVWDGNYWISKTSSSTGNTAKIDLKPSVLPNKIKAAAAPELVKKAITPKGFLDFSIDEEVVWEDKEINLAGGIQITKTGKLTMKNVTIRLVEKEGSINHYPILVNGGALKIENCKIIGNTGNRSLNITVQNAKSFEMRNSELYYGGAWQGYGAVTVGDTENVIVENNKFEGCYTAVGVRERCGVVSIKNNKITNSYIGIELVGRVGQNLTVTGNEISKFAYYGIRSVTDTSPSFANIKNYCLIADNKISDGWGDGIYESDDNIINMDDIYKPMKDTGVIVKNNTFTNIKGAALVKKRCRLEFRSLRVLSTQNCNVKAKENIDLNLLITDVKALPLVQYIDGYKVKLMVGSKVIAEKKVNLKPGDSTVVNLKGQAPVAGDINLYVEDCSDGITQHIPSSWAVFEVRNANQNKLTVKSLMSNYKSAVTYEEAYGLAVRIYEALTGKTIKAAVSKQTTNVDALKAKALGIATEDKINKSNLAKPVSRQEYCWIVYETLKQTPYSIKFNPNGGIKFTDSGTIASWAKEAVQFFNATNVLYNDGTNKFKPLTGMTKEEAIFIIGRVHGTNKWIKSQGADKK